MAFVVFKSYQSLISAAQIFLCFKLLALLWITYTSL